MKDLLTYLVQSIVDNPHDVSVQESTAEQKTILTIHANQADLGKIIGRGGRIIAALRDLIKIVATKHNTYADVEIAEESREVAEEAEVTEVAKE